MPVAPPVIAYVPTYIPLRRVLLKFAGKPTPIMPNFAALEEYGNVHPDCHSGSPPVRAWRFLPIDSGVSR